MKRWQGRIPFALLYISLSFPVSPGLLAVFHPLIAGGPYRGRVIDAETKQPLEGAVVLAIWETKTPGVAGYGYSYLDSEEVLTDENGRFVVGRHPPKSLFLAWVDGPAHWKFFILVMGFIPDSMSVLREALGGEEELLK